MSESPFLSPLMRASDADRHDAASTRCSSPHTLWLRRAVQLEHAFAQAFYYADSRERALYVPFCAPFAIHTCTRCFDGSGLRPPPTHRESRSGLRNRREGERRLAMRQCRANRGGLSVKRRLEQADILHSFRSRTLRAAAGCALGRLPSTNAPGQAERSVLQTDIPTNGTLPSKSGANFFPF